MHEDIFGLVSGSDVFRQRFATALHSLWSVGTRETIARYIAGTL